MGLIKLTKRKKKIMQLISGIGFLIIGLYMILALNSLRGQIPLFLGVAILLWRMK